MTRRARQTRNKKFIFERLYLIMANKVTKRELFMAIRERVMDDAEMVTFIDHEIELLDNKRNTPRTPTKTQLENETYKSLIVEYLTVEDAPRTIKEIQAGIPALAEFSNQKITHLLSALVNAGIVIKTYEKKTPKYTIAQ